MRWIRDHGSRRSGWLVATGCLLAWVWTDAAARDAPGSVRVRVVGLEAVPPDIGARRFAVRVSIGSKRLYQTPWARGPEPTWGRSLRAFTAAGNPLVFEVVSETTAREEAPGGEPPATAPRPARPPGSQDRTLATGFEELVGDWEAGLSPPPARPSPDQPNPAATIGLPHPPTTIGLPHPPTPDGKTARPRRPARPQARQEPTTLCRARLSWPPSDGEHRVPCGTMVLVVHTTGSFKTGNRSPDFHGRRRSWGWGVDGSPD